MAQAHPPPQPAVTGQFGGVRGKKVQPRELYHNWGGDLPQAYGAVPSADDHDYDHSLALLWACWYYQEFLPGIVRLCPPLRCCVPSSSLYRTRCPDRAVGLQRDASAKRRALQRRGGHAGPTAAGDPIDGWRLWVALSSKADQVKSLRAKTALNICPLLDLARNNTSSTEAMT